MADGSGRRIYVLIGAGCAVVGMIGLIVLCCAGGLFGGLNSMRDNDAVNGAVALVEADPAASARLGPPLHVGWGVQGSVSVSNDDGSANLVVPIQGSLESAQLSIVAERHGGVWSYEEVELVFDQGQDRMTLVGE